MTRPSSAEGNDPVPVRQLRIRRTRMVVVVGGIIGASTFACWVALSSRTVNGVRRSDITRRSRMAPTPSRSRTLGILIVTHDHSLDPHPGSMDRAATASGAVPGPASSRSRMNA